jgi:alpha-amylase
LAIRITVALALVAALPPARARAQAGFSDDRVMLQGFYWESYRHGHPENPQYAPYGAKHWDVIVRELAPTIHGANFDLVWIAPASFAGSFSAGYNPKQLFRLDSSYGTLEEHRAMLQALLQNGLEPIADLVLNHRDGDGGWATFKDPPWGTWAICKTDEAFSTPESGVMNTPERGDCEERAEYRQDLTFNYGSFRDVAHTDKRVRDDVIRLMLHLRSLGYRGWRYDMVHGYHARWIACYNAATTPTFSVGEYDWDKHAQQRGWMWATSTSPSAGGADRLRSASSVFDFTTYGGLKAINEGRYRALYGYGAGIGMVGDTTDGLPWKNRAVTFVENHDTGFRTNDDGTPEWDHKFDSFANTWQVEQAYAHVLTHPGVPTVYWKHFFDWGQDLQNKIRALINARKVAGVHAGSALFPQENARAAGVYAARVEGSHGPLYVRIGGSDRDWDPSRSGYKDYREYAQGAGWKVWVALPGNPGFRQAPLRAPFPVPSAQPLQSISVPNVALCQ